MNKVIFAAATIALWTPAANAGSQDTSAEAVTEADAQTSTNTIVCRRLAAPTGSRIGSRRVCKTEREWNAINAEARNEVEDAQNRSKGWSE